MALIYFQGLRYDDNVYYIMAYYGHYRVIIIMLHSTCQYSTDIPQPLFKYALASPPPPFKAARRTQHVSRKLLPRLRLSLTMPCCTYY